MAKLIIETENISNSDAIKFVTKVMDIGFVSKNYTQYCYVTVFEEGTTVYADKTKNGSFKFVVRKPY